MRNRRWISGILVGCLCGVACQNSATDKLAATESAQIQLRHVSQLENPFSDDSGEGNSHLLPGSDHNRRTGPQMAPTGPCFAVTWARHYEDCTVAFYNARLEMVAT
jgi:hypothetical protein